MLVLVIETQARLVMVVIMVIMVMVVEGGEDCDDFNKDCTGGGDVWRGEDSMKKDCATNGDDH